MAETLGNFIDIAQKLGLEQFGMFLGIYRSKVARNDDPDGRGRIQVICPHFGDQPIAKWIDPLFRSSGPDRGEFFPPELGDNVFVRFDRGRPDEPIAYLGGPHTTAGVPAEFAGTSGLAENSVPEVRGFISRMGHRIIWSDKDGDESIRIIWHKADGSDPAKNDRSLSADRSKGDSSALLFNPDGSILITSKDGTLIHLDPANGEFKIIHKAGGSSNILSMTSDGVSVVDQSGSSLTMAGGKIQASCKGEITVNGASLNAKTGGVFLGDGAQIKAILGDPFMALFNAHVHATGLGPSGPPIPPMVPAMLSNSVKLKP